ncbi:hypothetical protein HDU67_003766, partial [Dinochytrium kinnereticum]
MRLIIRDDYEAVAEFTEFDPTPERPFVLGLPTGSSPVGVYRKLVGLCREGELSFRNVVTFNM